MIKKTSFDSHPYPAGTNRKNAQVGLLTHPVCHAFPAFASGKECDKPKLLFLDRSRDTQQQELFRIRTGFPFHLSASNVASRLLVHCKSMLFFFSMQIFLLDFFSLYKRYIFDIKKLFLCCLTI